MTERLTWDEIRKRYPDQWVKLVDVIWVPNNEATVQSAVVARVGKPTTQDLIDAGYSRSYEAFTTPERHVSVGMAMI